MLPAVARKKTTSHELGHSFGGDNNLYTTQAFERAAHDRWGVGNWGFANAGKKWGEDWWSHSQIGPLGTILLSSVHNFKLFALRDEILGCGAMSGHAVDDGGKDHTVTRSTSFLCTAE